MSFELLETINDIPDGLGINERFSRKKINVAAITTGNERGYISLEDNTNRKIETTGDGTRIEPLIAYKGDRNLIYITGPSGAGKSIIASEFAKQYRVLNPDNRVYYCCSTDIKDDRTWGALDFVKAIDIVKLYESGYDPEIEGKMIKDLFTNSLIVFDDLDTLPSAKKKIMTRFQGKIVETGRKYEISCIIISHIVCGGVNTKMILNETNIYITFKGMIRGNRFLKHYKGLTDEQLESIRTTSWVAFNWRYGLVITPQSLRKL